MRLRDCRNCRRNQFLEKSCEKCYNDNFSGFEPVSENISELLEEEGKQLAKLMECFPPAN